MSGSNLDSLEASGLGQLELIHAQSKLRVPFSSLYEEGPVVVIFLRRWGCQLCRGYAKKLTTELVPTLKLNKLRIVAVGIEELGVQEFMSGRYFDNSELYIDEGKKFYGALGLRHVSVINGLGQLFSAPVRKWHNEVKAMGVSGNFQGDGMQMGGTFVLSGAGQIWFEHVQQNFGDHPEISTLIKILASRIPGFKIEPTSPESDSDAAHDHAISKTEVGPQRIRVGDGNNACDSGCF